MLGFGQQRGDPEKKVGKKLKKLKKKVKKGKTPPLTNSERLGHLLDASEHHYPPKYKR